MPNPADAQLRNAVQSFVDDLSELIRQAALEAVTDAVGGRTTTTASHRRPPRTFGAATARPARGRRGQKRTPEELERTTTALLGHIKKNPGQRIEEIAVALGVGSKELALPARKLIAAKSIKTQGRKRSTKYFPR